MEYAVFLKSTLLFNSFYCLLFINKALRFNNSKTRTTLNLKIWVFVTFVEGIIYLFFYSLYDCTFPRAFIKVNRIISFGNESPTLTNFIEYWQYIIIKSWNFTATIFSVPQRFPETLNLWNRFVGSHKIFSGLMFSMFKSKEKKFSFFASFT